MRDRVFFEKISAKLYLGTVCFEKRSGIIWLIMGVLQISSVRKKENLEVRQMRRVVIDMQNALFADAVAEALRRFDPEKVVME